MCWIGYGFDQCQMVDDGGDVDDVVQNADVAAFDVADEDCA